MRLDNLSEAKKDTLTDEEKEQAYDAIINDFTLSTIKKSHSIYPKVVNEVRNKFTLLHIAIEKEDIDVISFLMDTMLLGKINQFHPETGHTAVQSALINKSFELFRVIFDNKKTQHDKVIAKYKDNMRSLNDVLLNRLNTIIDAEKKLTYMLENSDQLTNSTIMSQFTHTYKDKKSVAVDYIKKHNLFDEVQKSNSLWTLTGFISKLFKNEAWDDFYYFEKRYPDIVYHIDMLPVYFQIGYSMKGIRPKLEKVDLKKFNNFDIILEKIANYVDNYKIDVINYLVEIKAPVTNEGIVLFLDKINSSDVDEVNTAVLKLMNNNKPAMIEHATKIFMDALKRRNYKIADGLLDWDINIDEIDQNGNTSLGIACSYNNIPMIKKLIAKKADVNYINTETDRDIFLDKMTSRLQLNDGENQIEILDILIAAGFKHLHRSKDSIETRGSIFNYLVYCKRDINTSNKNQSWGKELDYIMEIYNAMSTEKKKKAFDYTVKYNRSLTGKFIEMGFDLTVEFFEEHGETHAEWIKKSPHIASYVEMLLDMKLNICIPEEINDVFLF